MEIVTLDTSLTSTKPSYNRFAELQQKILQSQDNEIELHIEIEKRLGLSFLFCISTLPMLADSKGKTIHIICNNKSFALFKHNGYILCKNNDRTDIASELKTRSRIIRDVDTVRSLVTEITKDAPVQMSDNLAAIFISKAGEMYNNSLEHSKGTCVIGGKYFKNQKNKYCFSCYDTGIGIPQKIKQMINPDYSEEDAFKWAMQRGNSTANKPLIPRGLGLSLLQSFAKANEGAIRICSGRVLYTYSQKKKNQYFKLSNKFEGTLFEMDIIADDHHRYVLQ